MLGAVKNSRHQISYENSKAKMYNPKGGKMKLGQAHVYEKSDVINPKKSTCHLMLITFPLD